MHRHLPAKDVLPDCAHQTATVLFHTRVSTLATLSFFRAARGAAALLCTPSPSPLTRLLGCPIDKPVVSLRSRPLASLTHSFRPSEKSINAVDVDPLSFPGSGVGEAAAVDGIAPFVNACEAVSMTTLVCDPSLSARLRLSKVSARLTVRYVHCKEINCRIIALTGLP